MKIDVGIQTKHYQNLPPLSFTNKGRLISYVSDLQSFQQFMIGWKKRNPNKVCVWDRPQVNISQFLERFT